MSTQGSRSKGPEFRSRASEGGRICHRMVDKGPCSYATKLCRTVLADLCCGITSLSRREGRRTRGHGHMADHAVQATDSTGYLCWGAPIIRPGSAGPDQALVWLPDSAISSSQPARLPLRGSVRSRGRFKSRDNHPSSISGMILAVPILWDIHTVWKQRRPAKKDGRLSDRESNPDWWRSRFLKVLTGHYPTIRTSEMRFALLEAIHIWLDRFRVTLHTSQIASRTLYPEAQGRRPRVATWGDALIM